MATPTMSLKQQGRCYYCKQKYTNNCNSIFSDMFVTYHIACTAHAHSSSKHALQLTSISIHYAKFIKRGLLGSDKKHTTYSKHTAKTVIAKY